MHQRTNASWKSSYWYAALMYTLSCFFYSSSNIISKFVVQELDTCVLICIKSTTACVALLLFIGVRFLKKRRIKGVNRRLNLLNIVDGVLSLLALIPFYIGLALIPAAEVVSLSFTSTIFVLLLSVIMLNERLTIRSTIALAASFIAMLIIVQPSGDNFNIGAIYILITAFIWGFRMVLIKRISVKKKQDKVFIMLYSKLVIALPTTILVIGKEVPPLVHIEYMICSALVSLLGSVLFLHSCVLVPMRSLMPLDFSRLIFISVMGYTIFNEVLTYNVLLGAIIIFSSGLLVSMDKKEEV